MLTATAIILLGIVLVLVMPVDIVFDIQRFEDKRTDVTLRFLFGLIRLPLPAQVPGKSTKAERQALKQRTPKRRREGKRLTLLRNARLRRRFIGFLRQLIRSVRVRSLDIQMRLGLDDPADTGRLWGVIGPVSTLLASIPKAHVWIEPQFSHAALSVRGQGCLRIIPLQTAWVCLTFCLSPVVIRAMTFD